MNILDIHKKQFTTREECNDFLKSVIYDYKCNTHPDDSFVDIVDLNTNELVFSKEDAEILDARMQDCFDIIGDDTYDVLYRYMTEYMV